MSAPAIIKYPHPTLRVHARPVKSVTDELRALANSMIESMHAANGIGLAAVQVNRPLRLFVAAGLDHEDKIRNDPFVFFNPEIVAASDEMGSREEGCLSIPGISALVSRPAAVTMRALDINENEIEVQAEGLLAACLQHEMDHLNGVLFVDHLSRLKKNRLLAKYRRLAESESDD